MNPTCPYCGADMKLVELGLSQNHIAFYECTACLSRSPMTTNKGTAKGMAKMRRKGIFDGVDFPKVQFTCDT